MKQVIQVIMVNNEFGKSNKGEDIQVIIKFFYFCFLSGQQQTINEG